jgi:hypothetical protein
MLDRRLYGTVQQAALLLVLRASEAMGYDHCMKSAGNNDTFLYSLRNGGDLADKNPG